MQRLRLWLVVLVLCPAILAGCSDDGDTNPVIPTDKADLIVESIAFNPAIPTPTQQTTATVTVKNNGTASSVASMLEVKVNGVASTGEVAVPQVSAGGQATVTYTLSTLAAGDHQIQACADKGSAVGESSETNNCLAATLTVSAPAAGPDLVIQNMTFDPTSPTPAQSVTVTVTVKNIGTGAAGASAAEVKVDGVTSCAAIAVPTLAVNAEANVTCVLGTLPAGGHTVLAIADPVNAIPETGEANNSHAWSLSVTGESPLQPDLVIDEITLSPLSPGPSDPITATIQVRNSGDAAAAPSGVRVLFDGQEYCAGGTIPALDPGSTATYLCVFGAHPAGDYAVEACADFGAAVAESNETNNCLVETAVVAGADLEFPTIPAVPILQTVNLNSTDAGAIAAKQQIEQFYLGPAAILTSLGPALIQAIESFDWQAEGGECWTTTAVEGNCTYTYRMCKVGGNYELEAKATGTCDEGTGLADFVTWRGTVSLDGRTGEVFSFEPETAGPVTTWNWEVSADQSTGLWRGYSGVVDPGNLDWSFDFQQETGGTQHLVWVMPQAVRWTLDANQAGTQGTLSADLPGEGGWEKFEEIEWQANGHGTWTQNLSDPPTVREW